MLWELPVAFAVEPVYPSGLDCTAVAGLGLEDSLAPPGSSDRPLFSLTGESSGIDGLVTGTELRVLPTSIFETSGCGERPGIRDAIVVLASDEDGKKGIRNVVA